MTDVSTLKEKVQGRIEEISGELEEIAKRIFDNPELKFEEYKAAEWLAEKLEEEGWEVEREVAGMETSFRAVHPEKSEGPAIAFLCEYDALPQLGHGCGHNLIAAIGLGAGLGLAAAKDELPGRIEVIGAPAEEGGGGKVELVDAGVFQDLDAAMMVHPSSRTLVGRGSLSIQEFKFDFYGESTHASAEPEKGINALDAAIATFNNINAFREHVKDGARIHGIILDGGEKPNIVPEHASAMFYVRAPEEEYMKELVERVKDCARAGALAAGAELEIERQGPGYKAMKPNPVLAERFKENLKAVGEEMGESDGGMGSTDMGDVSQVLPAIHGYIDITDGDVPGHSWKFVEAADSEKGYRAMVKAAKVLALIGVDVLSDQELVEEMWEEFENS